MKVKNLFLTGCVALGLMFCGVVHAADLNGAIIEKIGVNPSLSGTSTSANIIFLSHPSLGSGKVLQCVMTKALGDAGLATALTAQSLGKPVWARVSSTDVTKVNTVSVLYLNK